MCQSGGWTFHTPGLPFCRKTGAKIRDERVCERAQGDGVQRCFPVAIKNVSIGTRPTRPPTHPTGETSEKHLPGMKRRFPITDTIRYLIM